MARIVFIGLSITSSWGNGHATTYRGLIKALHARGHETVFLERDMPWYAAARDLPDPPYCRTILYPDMKRLERLGRAEVEKADAVIVGSYVPDGIEVGHWALSRAGGPVLFYDIDTPVTLAGLETGEVSYIDRELIARYDAYLSFTGGPVLRKLMEMGSPCAVPLYCSVDLSLHRPVDVQKRWRLGYLGTYSPDRQSGLERLLLGPARDIPAAKFVVAGAQYPESMAWPANVERVDHLPPDRHPAFYCGQDFTLNLTRADMRAVGYAPSVRLFEAAACGVPVISDYWPGLDSIFKVGTEILVAEDGNEVVAILRRLGETQRRKIAHAARAKVLSRHSADRRAGELEGVLTLIGTRATGRAA